MINPARIVHRTEGRVRIEIPGRRSEPAFFAALSEQLVHSRRVRRLRVNPAAASLVLEYEGELGELIPELAKASLDVAPLDMAPLDMVQPGAAASRWPETLAGAGAGAGAVTGAGAGAGAGLWRLARAGGEQADPMLMASAAFGVLGLVQVLRGQIMIPALSAFWYAASAWRFAQLPQNTPAPAPAGDALADKVSEVLH